jgi:hypothetical protein
VLAIEATTIRAVTIRVFVAMPSRVERRAELNAILVDSNLELGTTRIGRGTHPKRNVNARIPAANFMFIMHFSLTLQCVRQDLH